MGDHTPDNYQKKMKFRKRNRRQEKEEETSKGRPRVEEPVPDLRRLLKEGFVNEQG